MGERVIVVELRAMRADDFDTSIASTDSGFQRAHLRIGRHGDRRSRK